MKVKFTGPQGYVDVLGYGRHQKGEVKEYSQEIASELLRDSHGRFEAVADRKPKAKSQTKK